MFYWQNHVHRAAGIGVPRLENAEG
jgi:hypothetical protein